MKRTQIFIAAAFLLFLISIFILPTVFTDCIAVFCDLLAAGLVFHAIITSKMKKLRVSFILAGIAILSWAAADLLWLIDAHVLRADPDANMLISVLYFGTNAFLLLATLSFSFVRIQKWDSVRLILDAATFSLATLWFLWILLFDKQNEALGYLRNHSAMNVIAIGIDFFLIIISGIWFLSVSKNGGPWFFKVALASIFGFAAIDLIYFYLYAVGSYVPDTLIDACYMAALFGIAFGIKTYYIKYPSAFSETGAPHNSGNGLSYGALLILLYPAIIIIAKGFVILDLAIFAILLGAYEYGRSFINKAVKDREQLSRERNANQRLEQLVAEQMQSLKSANAELLQKNKDLKFANLHDPLTGLNNRAYFLDTLETMIRKASASPDASVALILWNIDNLKGVNDTYGHLTGDKILIQHTQRVRTLLEGGFMLARLGGDEFAIILRGNLRAEEVFNIARRVVDTCKEPFHIHGYSFNVTIGVGISMYPECANDRSSLLRNADVAMHYAKENKPDERIATYMDIDTAMTRKNIIGNHLKTLDFDKDLHLHFQPQFRTATRRLIGMEALLRWDCPDIGPVSPAEFIPIAEEENLIVPIGNWVIENAVSQIAKWNRAYHTDLRMGINISPKQFDQASTFDVLDAAIKRHRAMFKWIDIEITENVALDFEDSAGNIKRYFKTQQLTISIDDFGTGYSSLGYLAILSFDRLKIAKPLVDKITTDESSRKIVTSIVLLAKSLDLQTIAEGVETKAQFDLLKKLGCDQIQGFYLGRPVPAEEFENTYMKEADV